MNSRSLSFLIANFIVAIATFTLSAKAHEPGLSTSQITLDEKSLKAAVTIGLHDLEHLPDFKVPNAKIALQVLQVNGTPAKLIRVTIRDNHDAIFEFASPANKTADLQISSPIIANLARGHRQYLVVRDEKGNVITEALLTAQAPSAPVPRREKM